MLILRGTRAWVFTLCSGMIWNAAAAQTQSPLPAGDTASQRQDASTPGRAVVERPMDMDEPMDTGMMKKGMMKGDVKDSAEKHAKKMKEELEKEEGSMPSMPPQTPRPH